MLNKSQQKVLSRLAHLNEFAPCNTNEFDYLLRSQGLVKINKLVFQGKDYFDTTLTDKGFMKLNHLAEEKA
jgi:hypothetical protein